MGEETKSKSSIWEKLNSENSSHLFELIIVIFLGITSVLGSFSAYESALHGSAMSKEYNEGIATITDANELYVEAGQVLSKDQASYMQLISLQYDWAYSEVGSDEEAKAEDIYNEFYAKFISVELDEAINWAAQQEEDTGYYTSPFEYQPYLDAVYADANEVYQEGRDRLEKGHQYNTWGDQMGLIVIYYATVLFLLGICPTLKRNGLKLGLLAFSAAIFVFATVQMFQIPFLFP